MTTDSVDSLEDLGGGDKFAAYRHSEEFKTNSLVIDTSNSGHSTLIVHADGKSWIGS